MFLLCEVHDGVAPASLDNGLYFGAGLVSFIADLRNARARELEEKRINKELANIRWVPRATQLETNTADDTLQTKVQRYLEPAPGVWLILTRSPRWRSQWLPEEEIRLQGTFPTRHGRAPVLILQSSSTYTFSVGTWASDISRQ
jgi:hypothetical protein